MDFSLLILDQKAIQNFCEFAME